MQELFASEPCHLVACRHDPQGKKVTSAFTAHLSTSKLEMLLLELPLLLLLLVRVLMAELQSMPASTVRPAPQVSHASQLLQAAGLTTAGYQCSAQRLHFGKVMHCTMCIVVMAGPPAQHRA